MAGEEHPPGAWPRHPADASRKIPVFPALRRDDEYLGLASGPPGGRRAASALNRATWTVCHTGYTTGQPKRERLPDRRTGRRPREGELAGKSPDFPLRHPTGTRLRHPGRTAHPPAPPLPRGRRRPGPPRRVTPRGTPPAPPEEPLPPYGPTRRTAPRPAPTSAPPPPAPAPSRCPGPAPRGPRRGRRCGSRRRHGPPAAAASAPPRRRPVRS